MKYKNRDGSTTYRVGNREVTAWPLVETFFEDKPCYMVRLVGDEDLFFDQECTILSRKEEDGLVFVYYFPGEIFKESINRLVELGGWG